MKLKKGFVAHDAGKETMLISTGEIKFSGIVRSNESAGFIIHCLEEETTEAGIVAKMQKKFDGDKAAMERDVKKVVEQLRGIGAIEG